MNPDAQALAFTPLPLPLPPTSPRRSRLVCAWGLVVLVVGPNTACSAPLTAPVAAHAAQPQPAPPLPADGERVRLLVSFVEPSVASKFAGVTDAGSPLARQDAMRAYAAALRSARQTRIDAMGALGSVVVSTMEYSANAALVELQAAHAARFADAVRRLPGVISVQPAGVYRTDPLGSAPPPASR